MRFVVVFLLAALPAFSLAQGKPWKSSPENVFYINGEKVKLSRKLLADLRDNWASGESRGPFQSAVKGADLQWALDLISIRETLHEPPCEKLILLSIEKLQGFVDTIEGHEIVPGAFDEFWTIEACGIPRYWRVLHEKGSRELSVYELSSPPPNNTLVRTHDR